MVERKDDETHDHSGKQGKARTRRLSGHKRLKLCGKWLAPNGNDCLTNRIKECLVQNLREWDNPAIPEAKLSFSRHGLPEQQHVGGGQDQASAIQVSHSFESQAWWRNRSQHRAIVTPEMPDG